MHTPGPWSWDGKFTVGIPHKDGDTFFRTNPEDAALIAAAPELLAALKALVGYDSTGASTGMMYSARMAQAHAAIAKAEPQP